MLYIILGFIQEMKNRKRWKKFIQNEQVWDHSSYFDFHFEKAKQQRKYFEKLKEESFSFISKKEILKKLDEFIELYNSFNRFVEDYENDISNSQEEDSYTFNIKQKEYIEESSRRVEEIFDYLVENFMEDFY